MARASFARRAFLAGAGVAVLTPRWLLTPLPAWAVPRVGAPAPTFTAGATSGQNVGLAEYQGKIVVLEWTNHDCPYVRKHYDTGNMQALQKEATGQGVTWLTIISSAPGTQGHVSPSQADELTVKRNASPSAVLLDPTGVVGRMYGATNTPHMYVIDRTGTLVYAGAIDDKPTSRRGDVPGAQNYVRLALQSVATGQPVKTPVTRAYGCTVKYP
jgi:peroxiredoxin